MATGMQVWSVVPVTNASADSNVNFAEGMAPSQVGDSARSLMASVAKWRDDNSGSLITSGTSSALTVATNQVESALTTGFTVTATLGSGVAAAATLAVDGLSAVPIFTSLSSASALSTGQLIQGQVTSFVYSTAITGTAQAWIIKAVSPGATSISPLLTTLTNSLVGDVSMNSTASGTFADGPVVSQGSSGVWYASGTIVVSAASGTQNIIGKLWDGTTTIASATNVNVSSAWTCIALSGAITSPAGNIRISGLGGTFMRANQSGSGQDSTITVIRIG